MGTLQMLLLAWGVVTAILVCMWIYRSTLENREEDQIFLDAAGDSMARDQAALVARIEKLGRPIIALMIASGALLCRWPGSGRTKASKASSDSDFRTADRARAWPSQAPVVWLRVSAWVPAQSG